MTGNGVWSVLGIEPTQDLSVIKRAYARQLKSTRPDVDPEGYQRLREAFDTAKNYWDIREVVTDTEPVVENSAPAIIQMPVQSDFLAHHTPVTEQLSVKRWKVISKATEIIDEMMDDETAGLRRLASFEQSSLLQNIELHELFNQELAAQLSEREGLYSALLNSVSAIMGWEIDHYQPGGISAQRLYALQAQIEKTGANYYWSVMARNGQLSVLDRLRFRLLTVEGTTLPWWAKLMPDFIKSLNEKVSEIRAYYPSLLPRINSRLLKSLSETRLVISWGTAFLAAFWLLLIFTGTRELPEPWPTRAVLIAITGLYIHGYRYFESKLRFRPRLLFAMQCVLSLISTAIMVRMLLGFFTIFKPEVGELVMAITNYGVLCASSFSVLWMMAPKHWKWYCTPLNAMTALVVFPWELMRRNSGVVGVVVFILMLGVYALLLAFAIR
ncbi:hypothetical protein CWS43_21345 [Rahnella sp. AA]|uniref:hypothetical protein n=1 Tax=Rahnella sp. AA TaxID=2057180 RepID=UPI000C34CE3D|nr:hypothetical protein [Rahnella sp. AA]PKE28577.1 hypothetical protein CWS43_21345 [Rahnella sp. AA]